MTALPDSAAPDDQPPDVGDDDLNSPIPEWAPLEPLPSSEMFLATFSGSQPVTAGDILHPAYDLVECQRDQRLAFDVLAEAEARPVVLKAAVRKLMTAQMDITMLIAVIDNAVADRMTQQRQQAGGATPQQLVCTVVDGLAHQPMHTESIGEVVARMAELWGATIATLTQPTSMEFPETLQLVELCLGYDCLAAEIESGRRLLPGM